MPIFSTSQHDQLAEPMFFGNALNVARYDVQKYPIFEKLNEQMLSYRWMPQEVELIKDSRDFKNLTIAERSIFINNLKYQILLDSVQARGPNLALLPYTTLPELEGAILTWSFYESIHSRSYTYIIRNLYAVPGDVLDHITDDDHIISRAADIAKYYDDFINYANIYALHGFGVHQVDGEMCDINEYGLKRRLYMMLIAINALEGIRFYVSFMCSFAFAELSYMEGNAKIIALIARDENLHLAITQNILKMLPKEDPMYARIIEDCEPAVYKLYDDVVNQEKAWAAHLFDGNSMIGLNTALLCQYVEYIANKRMRTIGLRQVYHQKSNPLAWSKKYLSSSSMQVAPQETEISSYIVGSLDNNVSEDTFADFVL